MTKIQPEAAIFKEFEKIPPEQIRRIFDYDRHRLPNAYLAEMEAGCETLGDGVLKTGLSIGYPAWNLLYYSLFCSINSNNPIVIETGTNLGFSTIVMAQALKDRKVDATVKTVEINPLVVEQAKNHARQAEVEAFIQFFVENSIIFLQQLATEISHIDFAFLDGNHTAKHLISEFELVYPLVKACRGKVFFDNTSSGGVAEALQHIHSSYGGNLIEFANCSWSPPGNAIWQP